ncbi:MAG TPA: hypothetical protein VEU62_03220, partial [Bryobacterales bacterium]|nr:hypothetical protein [Bryobacterales bacterium]
MSFRLPQTGAMQPSRSSSGPSASALAAAGERRDSPPLAWTAHLLAFLASLCFSLPLRLAGQLGFYDNDYNQIQEFLNPDRPLRTHLLRYFLTDEPLFNVYHALRHSILGERPWPHHALQGILLAVSATLAFSLVWRLSKDRLLPFVFLLLF